MRKEIYYQIKDLEVLAMRSLFNFPKKEKFKPPTITQARIMKYILENKDKEIFQKDLEHKLNLRRATVSEVLSTMEKKGLIKREKNERDARSNKIILSMHESNEYYKIKQNIEKLEQKLIENISKDELNTFISTLEKMKENLKK